MTRLLLLLVATVAIAGIATASARPARSVRAGRLGTVPDLAGATAKPPPSFGAPRARVADTLPYRGGPVLHSNVTHLIFWQPAGSGLTFDAGYMQQIETFMTNVAADDHLTTNVYGISGQYSDSQGPAAYDTTYGGAVVDTDPLPTKGCNMPLAPPLDTGPGWSDCVNDNQIEAELGQIVSADSLPTASNEIYFVLTPSGLGSCYDNGPDQCSDGGAGPDPNNPYNSYCGYHSATPTGLLYAVIPYNAVAGHCQSSNPRPSGTTADPVISTISHEHAETVTDPLGDAWVDPSGNEEADLCAQSYGAPLGGSVTSGTAWNEVINGAHYWLQEEWSDESGTTTSTACQPKAPTDSISATIPRRVYGDRAVKLKVTAHAPFGSIVGYEWAFGDGASAKKGTVTHVFRTAGTFTVVALSIDAFDNYAVGGRVIRVLVPPRPTVTVTAGPGPVTTSHRPRFRFASNAALVTYECRIDTSAVTACRSPFTAPSLGAGSHRLTVRAVDSFAQLSRKSATYPFSVA
jgi:hypothetical protein